MHTDMTAVPIQSNKIVLNEMKDKCYQSHLTQKKKLMNFLANPVFGLLEQKASYPQKGSNQAALHFFKATLYARN